MFQNGLEYLFNFMFERSINDIYQCSISIAILLLYYINLKHLMNIEEFQIIISKVYQTLC